MVGPGDDEWAAVPSQPTAERIDDDVELPQREEDTSDDDELYTGSDPLIARPGRSGLQPKQCERRWWNHKWNWNRNFFRKTSWMRETYGPGAAPWEETLTKSQKRWRLLKIILILVFVAMAIAIIVLSVLVAKLRRPYRPVYTMPSTRTHLPFYQSKYYGGSWYYGSPPKSVALNQVYPQLDHEASDSCKEAWQNAGWLGCHEKVLNRAWDDGKQNLFDPEVTQYTNTLCFSNCLDQLRTTRELVTRQCGSDDYFDTHNYTGPFSTDPKLEAGPSAALDTLVTRLEHTCRQVDVKLGSGRYTYNTEYCVDQVYNRFQIVDGINADNLNGLEIFGKMTAKSADRNWYDSRYIADQCDGVAPHYGGYRRHSGARHVGPEIGETNCEWCTLNWFERKLNAWGQDKITDPQTGDYVDLEDFIHRVRHYGQRCERSEWNRIYERAIRRYKDLGLLELDWEDKPGYKPRPRISSIAPVATAIHPQ